MKICYVVPSILLAITSNSILAQPWGQEGYNDGVDGKQMRYLNTVSLNEYTLGYEKGLSEFCILENATKLGKAGKVYLGVCDSNENGTAFNAAYKDALEQHKQEEWLKLGNRNWY